MTNKKTTKRALLMSVVSMLLCVAMLLGTTFAWFTDSVTSGRNQILAGNLDVELEYKTDWDDEWAPVTENTKLFKEGALYEPGYTEVVYFRVSNKGSLALKYNMDINVLAEQSSTNVYGDAFKLSDYLEIGTYVQDEYSSGFNYADLLMPGMFGTREAALNSVKNMTKLSEATGVISSDAALLPGEDTAQVGAIVLTMPTTVDNVANHKTGEAAPTIDLGINLVATQHQHEDDSFDYTYDAGALFLPEDAKEIAPGLYRVDDTAEYYVASADGLASLNEMMLNKTAGKDVTVELVADIDFTGKTWTPVDSQADTAFTFKSLDGNGHTISNLTVNGQAMFKRFAGFGNVTVTVKDVTFDNADVKSTALNTSILTVQAYQNVVLDNVDVTNSTITGAYKVAPLIATVYNEKADTVTATLRNCDVSNTVVIATQHDFCTAGMVAFVHAGDNDKIEFKNCTVTDVKLYAPNSYKAHAAVYTTGSGSLFDEAEGVTVTNVTFTNR